MSNSPIIKSVFALIIGLIGAGWVISAFWQNGVASSESVKIMENPCSVDSLEDKIRVAVSDIDKHLYYRVWLEALHPAQWDPIPYIVSKLPKEGTCNGQMFAIQKVIYASPIQSAAADVAAANPQDVITFDVMRLTYTELFRHVVNLEMLGVQDLPHGVDAASLRADFQSNLSELLGDAHLAKSINQPLDLKNQLDDIVALLTAELTPLADPNAFMTAYVNIIGGMEVSHSMLLKAIAPDFVLFDTNAPGDIVRMDSQEGRHADLPSLVKTTIDYINQAYFSSPSLEGKGYIQLQVYHRGNMALE